MAASFLERGQVRSPGTTRSRATAPRRLLPGPAGDRRIPKPRLDQESDRLMATRHPGDRRPSPLLATSTLLKSIASGFGYLAFAGLAHEAAARDAARQRRRRPRPQGAALPGAGQAGHLPVHERRAVARRHCSTTSPRSTSDRAKPRPSAATAAGPGCSARPSSSPSTASRGSGSRKSSPIWPSRPTTCASSAACTPTCRTTRRPSRRCTPAASSSCARRSAPGRSTAWAARTPTCPASSR